MTDKSHEQLWQEMDEAEAKGLDAGTVGADPGAKAQEAELPPEDPAPEPSAEETDTPSDESPPKSPPESPPESADDVWAEATEAQRQYVEDLQQRLNKSQEQAQGAAGRASGLQRKLNEMQAASTTPAPTTAQVEEAMASPEAFGKFEEDFPDFATPVKELVGSQVGALKKQLAQLQDSITPIREAQMHSHTEVERQKLATRHPDYEAVSVSTDFQDWLHQQPPAIREMAASDSADEAVWLLDTFKTATAVPTGEPVTDLKAHRQQRAQQAAMPSGSRRTAPPRPRKTGPAEDTHEAWWKYYDEQDQRQST